MRQWVLSVPKRLRFFLQRDGATLNMVLRIFLRVIAQSLQSHSPGAANADRAALHIGAVAFILRFGSSLNEHVHFHVCVVEGVFEEVVGRADAPAQTSANSGDFAPKTHAILRLMRLNFLSVIRPHCGPEVASISLDEARDLYALRRLLESYAAHEFTRLAGAGEIKSLGLAVKQLGEADRKNSRDGVLNAELAALGVFKQQMSSQKTQPT